MKIKLRSGNQSAIDLAFRIGALRGVHEVYQVGSTAIGVDDRYSDTDLLAVCLTLPSTATRLRCYYRSAPRRELTTVETLNLRSWEFGVSDSFKVLDAAFCVMYYTKSEIVAKIGEIQQGSGERIGFYLPTGFLNALATGRLVVSKEAVSRFQNIFAGLNEYPEALRSRVLTRNNLLIHYFFEKLSVGLSRHDLFYAQQCLVHLRESALSMSFAMARKYRVSDKNIEVALADFNGKVPPALIRLVRVLLGIVDYSHDSLSRCVITLAPLVKEVENIYEIR